MSARPSSPDRVYCPRCGAANDAASWACHACGGTLPSAAERDRDRISRTAPIPAQPVGRDRRDDARRVPVPPVGAADTRRRGPGGCVLGCLGLLIVLGVTGVVAAGLLIPFAREATLDGVRDIAATEAMRIGTLPVSPSGELILTEEDVNRQIVANVEQFDRFDPLGTPVFSIDPAGVTLTVATFRQTTTYRGGVAIEDGRLVITDPDVDGPAGSFLPADEIADFVEDLAGDLQDRSGVIFTGVELRQGDMVFSTRPAEATPATGGTRSPTSAAAPTAPATEARVTTATPTRPTPPVTSRPTVRAGAATATATPRR